MPKGGSRPGERRGGRRKGTKNKSVIERELLAQQAAEALGLSASKTILAKDALAEVMKYFQDRAREAAAAFLAMTKPAPAPTTKVAREERARYLDAEAAATKYMRAVADTADKLIGYQSPKLQHTTLVSPDPFESMSDEELQVELLRRSKELGLPAPNIGVAASKMN